MVFDDYENCTWEEQLETLHSLKKRVGNMSQEEIIALFQQIASPLMEVCCV